jgi:hypothetical protein
MPGQTYRITVRGETFTLDPGAITARDGAVVRRRTREAGLGAMSVMGILRSLEHEEVADLDLLAVLSWMARRQAGLVEDLGDVVDAFPTYGELSANPDLIGLVADDGTPADEIDVDTDEVTDSPLG